MDNQEEWGWFIFTEIIWGGERGFDQGTERDIGAATQTVK